jgi:putative ABC transport system permease protein
LLAVYGATAVILLMACLNVSNLLLIRGEARRKELAIRAALGSTRWRLVRELGSESLILSFIGGTAGVLLAWWCQGALLASAPSFLGIESSKLDLPVLVSALTATIIAASLSGLFPALWLSRGNLSRAVATTGRSTSPGRNQHWLLYGLVVGQIAVSMSLLFAVGLAVVSFQKLMRVDPGFATRNAICFRVGTFSTTAVAERISVDHGSGNATRRLGDCCGCRGRPDHHTGDSKYAL